MGFVNRRYEVRLHVYGPCTEKPSRPEIARVRSSCAIIAAMFEALLNLVGLFLGILGALLLALSVQRNPGEAYQKVPGKKI